MRAPSWVQPEHVSGCSSFQLQASTAPKNVHDPKPVNQFMVQLDRPVRVSAARASGFVLQSDDEPTFKPVSYLDSR